MDVSELLDYLIKKNPIVTNETLAEYLGADHRHRDRMIGQVPLETLDKLSNILKSETIFRPFEGIYRVTVSSGRIQFPPKLKYVFDLDPILTIVKKDWSLSLSLSLYPRKLYGREEPLSFYPEIKLDEHNRFYIPKYLREIAGIEKNAVVIGAGDQVVIADEIRFRKFILK